MVKPMFLRLAMSPMIGDRALSTTHEALVISGGSFPDVHSARLSISLILCFV